MGKFNFFKALVILLALVMCAKADIMGNYNRIGIGIQRDNEVGMFMANFARRQGVSDFGIKFGLGANTLWYDEEFGTTRDVMRNISFNLHYEFINHVIVGTEVGLNFSAWRYMDRNWHFDRWGDEIMGNWTREVEYRIPQFVLSPRIGYEWLINQNMKLQYRIIYSVALGSMPSKYLRDWGASNAELKFRNHSIGNDISIYRDWVALNFGFSFINVQRTELRERGFSDESRSSINLKTNLGISLLF
ncbi:MAG: hypothetical protein FWE23_06605 [Chitinivibrionia bacterium]|nr:hypothetical protein [Chitinivibrionia bacterium]